MRCGRYPDVLELRLRIGRTIRQRLKTALGDPDRRILNAPELACAGALVQAGMGHTSYAETADRLAETAELIVGSRLRPVRIRGLRGAGLNRWGVLDVLFRETVVDRRAPCGLEESSGCC